MRPRCAEQRVRLCFVFGGRQRPIPRFTYGKQRTSSSIQLAESLKSSACALGKIIKFACTYPSQFLQSDHRVVLLASEDETPRASWFQF